MTVAVTSRIKRVVEIISWVVDFSRVLDPGETIVESSAVYTVTLRSGIDPNPDSILQGPPTYKLRSVQRNLEEGLVGVVYSLGVSVTTTAGRVIDSLGLLAILPNNYPATGSYVSYVNTSKPYPYVMPVGDMLAVQASALGGVLKILIREYDFGDFLSVGAGCLDGDIRNILRSYSMSDYLSIPTVTVNDGELRTILITYAFTDFLAPHASTLDGTLDTILITHTQGDFLSVTASTLDGTLTT